MRAGQGAGGREESEDFRQKMRDMTALIWLAFLFLALTHSLTDFSNSLTHFFHSLTPFSHYSDAQ